MYVYRTIWYIRIVVISLNSTNMVLVGWFLLVHWSKAILKELNLIWRRHAATKAPGVHADELYVHYDLEKHGIELILEALHMATVQQRPDTPQECR